ncbi:transposase [Streptomyces sp. NPDC006798]|uniref:transposase n=1 Tax=Streptomyces sp. NPDC006798 TaxID=3155462 RepID=UPI0033F3B860
MRAWAAEQDWLTLERLPAYAPELNPVELLWSSLKKRELANLAGDHLADVADATEQGIHRINANPRLPWSFLAHTGLTIHPPHPPNLRKDQYVGFHCRGAPWASVAAGRLGCGGPESLFRGVRLCLVDRCPYRRGAGPGRRCGSPGGLLPVLPSEGDAGPSAGTRPTSAASPLGQSSPLVRGVRRHAT